MQRFDRRRNVPCALVVMVLALALPGCNNTIPPPAPRTDYVPAGPEQSQVDAQRLNDGASKLSDEMKRPVKAFQFGYSGIENLGSDPGLPPQVGSEILAAEISPQEIHWKETRGKEGGESKAEVTDDVNWNIAHLTMVRILSKPMLAIAVGATVIGPPSEDLVGQLAADKFVFDTSGELTAAQKVGLARARTVMSAIQNCKGTAWIAKDSGELVRFAIDAEYRGRDGQPWNEHYEGIVTPK